MKKLFFGIMATLYLLSFNCNAKNLQLHKKMEVADRLLKIRHFTGSITLSGGCHVSYSIDIDYSILPPGVNSIHGTLTLSGNCSGTQSFRASAVTNKKGEILSTDNNSDDEIIRSEEFKVTFAKSLNELKIFEEK